MFTGSIEYFAGLIDGEGHIGIHKHGKERNRQPILQLIMTDEYTVKLFADFCETTHRPRTSPSLMKAMNEKGHKLTYVCRIGNSKAYLVVKQLFPFLITKRKDALKFLAHFEGRCCVICNKELSPEVPHSRKYCSAACRQKYKRITGSAQRGEKKYAKKYRTSRKEKGAEPDPSNSLSC